MDDVFFAKAQLTQLIDALRQRGFLIVAPRVHNGAMIFAEHAPDETLPIGWRDEQQPGRYQLKQANDEIYFSWTTTAQSIKPWLFKPEETLWNVSKNNDGHWEFHATEPDPKPIAIIGVRACDLAALALQDKHFLYGAYVDPYYRKRRENLFLIAVNCTFSTDVCFCNSTGDGPRASIEYDIALTELETGFVLSIGSVRAEPIVQSLNFSAATSEQIAAANVAITRAGQQQTRKIPRDIQQTLLANQQSERWQKIADTCLACGNCTSVCPSCFCHREIDQGDLNLNHSTHVREWSSCFTQEHSYIHGLSIRPSIAFRYRQWLTHKFSTWFAQYGRSGCVGCGRCMTWCPVAIDITKELDEFSIPTHS